jgi:hypothetical protein
LPAFGFLAKFVRVIAINIGLSIIEHILFSYYEQVFIGMFKDLKNK